MYLAAGLITRIVGLSVDAQEGLYSMLRMYVAYNVYKEVKTTCLEP